MPVRGSKRRTAKRDRQGRRGGHFERDPAEDFFLDRIGEGSGGFVDLRFFAHENGYFSISSAKSRINGGASPITGFWQLETQPRF